MELSTARRAGWATIAGTELNKTDVWTAVDRGGLRNGNGVANYDGHAGHRSAFMPRLKGMVVAHRADQNLQHVLL